MNHQHEQYPELRGIVSPHMQISSVLMVSYWDIKIGNSREEATFDWVWSHHFSFESRPTCSGVGHWSWHIYRLQIWNIELNLMYRTNSVLADSCQNQPIIRMTLTARRTMQSCVAAFPPPSPLEILTKQLLSCQTHIFQNAIEKKTKRKGFLVNESTPGIFYLRWAPSIRCASIL